MRITHNVKERLYGGKFYRKLFEKREDGTIVFYARTFLLTYIGSQHVYELGKRVYKNSMPYKYTAKPLPTFVESMIKKPNFDKEFIKYLREAPFSHPLPIEDLLDLENGLIIITHESLKHW